MKPFIKDMTESELHAIMAGGFATIAGSVVGIYISFGIDPVALLASSAMSAPAALALSKLGKSNSFISAQECLISRIYILYPHVNSLPRT